MSFLMSNPMFYTMLYQDAFPMSLHVVIPDVRLDVIP
jgi:hypothetical protein